MQARVNEIPDLPWTDPIYENYIPIILPQRGVMYDIAFIIRAKPYGGMDLVALNQIRSGTIHYLAGGGEYREHTFADYFNAAKFDFFLQGKKITLDEWYNEINK